MEFGHYLKMKREEKGMTIRQLALYAGCSDSYISMLERGERGKQRPTSSILKKLAKPLGIPYEVLMEEAGYELEQAEQETNTKTIPEILRRSLGDTREQFAERIGLRVDEVERMERKEVSLETIQMICERLFAPHRALTPTQKRLVQRVEETFRTHASETSTLVEKLLIALLE